MGDIYGESALKEVNLEEPGRFYAKEQASIDAWLSKSRTDGSIPKSIRTVENILSLIDAMVYNLAHLSHECNGDILPINETEGPANKYFASSLAFKLLSDTPPIYLWNDQIRMSAVYDKRALPEHNVSYLDLQHKVMLWVWEYPLGAEEPDAMCNASLVFFIHPNRHIIDFITTYIGSEDEQGRHRMVPSILITTLPIENTTYSSIKHTARYEDDQC